MRAAVGDWLRLGGGRDAGQPQRTGQIIEIRGTAGEPPYLVRFRDGRTSLVIPGPGAVIAHSGPDEPVPAPGLMFRVTASQRRALVISSAVVTAVAVVLAGAALAVPNPARLAALAVSAGILALISVYYSVAYAAAYTECTPAGLRVRGVTRRRFLPWARLRDIAVRDYGSSPYRGPGKSLRIVIITADDGTRFWLGAPIGGGQGLGDPQFEDKIWQIRHYWRSRMSSGALPARRPPADHHEAGAPRASQAGSGIPGVRADPVPGQALNAFIVRAMRAAFVIVALLMAVVAFPITLRSAGPALSAALGHGQHGTFTAQAKSCPKGCLWYGDFAADNGTAENHVLLADGAAITGKGDVIAAVDVGRRGMVYPATGAADLYWVIILLLVEIGPAIYLLTWLTLQVRRKRRSRLT